MRDLKLKSAWGSSMAIPKNRADAHSDNWFLAYLKRCGVEFDVATNVLTGGALGETVSLRVAKEEKKEVLKGQDGWGCWFCWFLSKAVQKDHCALQFTEQPSPTFTYVRAGIAFGVAYGVLYLAAKEIRRKI